MRRAAGAALLALGFAALAACHEREAPARQPATRPAAPPAPTFEAPVAIGASPVPAVAPEPVAIGELPEVDSALRSAIAAKRLPGAVIAIGHRDGLVFLRAYGNRAVVPEVEPMTLDTIFDLASLTKPLTATLIMKRVEQGVVQLDEHASKYLPELAAHHGDVTVRELLLHTGAFAAENSLSDYQKGREAALAAIFRSRALSKRHEFHYSDLGYVVLGALLERVSNDSLDALAQRELFTPLHMRDTRFRPDASLRPRIAPTEVPDSVRKRIDPAAAAGEPVIRGDVHDPRAFLLGGVAGNAGAFTTASDLARFAQMLLSGGALDGVRVLRADTLAQMTAPSFVGTHDAVRALGWDMRSEYSGLRGTQLSYRAFGHGGYTGTSLWVDPDQDLFVIVLSNRVHPSGDGHMIKLAGEIADIASRHFARRPRPASCAALAGHVETGIDVLRAQDFAPLAGKRIGVVANDSSRTRDGLRTVDVLRQAKNVKLVALFAAEHGLDHSRHGLIADGADAATSLPVRSLYGKTKKPTPEMLRDVDAIVFDLQDVGVRFFTYLSTLRLILEAAAKQHVEVIVLDRPNPIGADVVEGALLEKASESFVGYHELPLRHGMTAGEIARMLIDERKIKAKLTVIAMRGYARELDYEQTGLRWYAPSPNLPDLDAVRLYPTLGLIEGANVSVGRGTGRPFSFVGAPWLDALTLITRVTASGEPGVQLSLLTITPESDMYAHELCHAVALHVVSPTSFRAVHAGVTLATTLVDMHRQQLSAGEMAPLIANQRTMDALVSGASTTEIERLWEPDLMRFAARRARYLLYPSCDDAPAPATSAP